MIRVQVLNAHPRYRIGRRRVAEYVRETLRREGFRTYAVTVVFQTSASSRRLNARWLHHREPTDVISFELGDARAPEGEVYVNLDRARLQARMFAVPFAHELARLVVHGTLHLTGMEDGTVGRRAAMRRREDALLARWF